MSSISSTVPRPLPRDSRARDPEPLAFRSLAAVLLVGAVALLAVLIGPEWSSIAHDLPLIAVWACLVAAVGLVPVAPNRGPRLDVDLPLLLAGAFVFGAGVGGVIALVGSLDLRELRREIGLARSLYNRSQKALSVCAAGLAFSAVGAAPGAWPKAIFGSGLAVVVDGAVNYGLVLLGARFLTGSSPRSTLARMTFGSVGGFALAYGSFGVLGVFLAEAFVRLGVWGLLSSLALVLLGRQAFAHGRDLQRVSRLLEARRRAFSHVSRRIQEERADERRRIAASLHDDVLQSLYNVTIHAHVIKEDIRGGRLLDLDDDIPALVVATEEAAEGLRGVIKGLRESALGRAGLASTLKLLVDHLREESSGLILLHLHDVRLSADKELLIYQVAREALVNACRHASAGTVTVSIREEGDSVRLSVADDGQGFDPGEVDESRHFGLQLMKERVALLGGDLQLRSTVGEGTRVEATLPRS